MDPGVAAAKATAQFGKDRWFLRVEVHRGIMHIHCKSVPQWSHKFPHFDGVPVLFTRKDK